MFLKKFLKIQKLLFHNLRGLSYDKSYRLDPIGLLQDVRTASMYESGQIFIHKSFGYRGIILKSVIGKLYDKDNVVKIDSDFISANYYNVLVDCRDINNSSYIKCGLTFLTEGNLHGDSIYIMPNMDYVSQDDVIPFTSSEGRPIINEYFNKFFIHCPDQDPAYVPTEKLTNWLSKHSKSLEITNIQRELTEDVRISVMPFYLGSVKDIIENDITRYWRYIVRIENFGDSKLVLRKRNLKIFSVSGRLETINGKGVVGNQPILSKENPVFQYHSHVLLKSSWGHMWGSYIFERENGRSFSVKIPSFPLCSNSSANPTSFETDDS